eukprot:12886538-Alexandrium_andersonii.AAC.1
MGVEEECPETEKEPEDADMEQEELRTALAVLSVNHDSKVVSGTQLQERQLQEWWAKFHIQQQKQIEAQIAERRARAEGG